ncbi:MAG TPA: hypothetical protein VET46_09895 [Steroidobacteraceae bacterium]|nr:hypothetical protein [Steroidobacteraceae bacterium]
MRHLRVLAVAVVLLDPSGPAQSATATATVVPVFHQLVGFTLPAPFKVAFEETRKGFYTREHVPEGESVDEWTRMVRLTGTQGLAYNRDASPQAYLQALARGFQLHCPDTYVQLELGPQAGLLAPSFVTVASCGRVTSGGKAHSETAVMLAIKGTDDYYTLQWVERGRDSAHPLALDGRYWTSKLAQLGPVRLCPMVPGEAAPYPSCAGH